MSAPERDPTDPAEWIRRARSNLARARQGKTDPEILFEDLCFDAQQAAEKALKALLISRGVDPPVTHSIRYLCHLLQGAGVEIPQDVRDADGLTLYAVEMRYPGASAEVSEEKHRQAVERATAVVRWAQQSLGPGPGLPPMGAGPAPPGHAAPPPTAMQAP